MTWFAMKMTMPMMITMMVRMVQSMAAHQIKGWVRRSWPITRVGGIGGGLEVMK